MPTFDIYYKGEKVESKEFKGSFLIFCYSQHFLEVFGDSILERHDLSDEFTSAAELPGRLFWGADTEKIKGGSALTMWIRRNGGYSPVAESFYSTNFEALVVLPEWQVTLDGVQLPRGSYEHVDFDGKHVSLKYGDYEFVCQFPEPAFDLG